MAHYLIWVQANLAKLSEWVVERVPRTENMKVDILVGIVATLSIKEVLLLAIYLQTTSSIAVTLVCNTSEENTN